MPTIDIWGHAVNPEAMPGDDGSAAPAERFAPEPVPEIAEGVLASVTVVVTVYNHPRVVRPCLRSFHRTTHPAVRLLIVDDGSDAYTKAMLIDEAAAMAGVHPRGFGMFYPGDERYERMHGPGNAGRRVIIIGHPNMRYTKTINVGFRRAFADGAAWAVALNSDILLTAGWLERMLASARDERVAMVCPYFSTVGSGDPGNPLQVALQPGATYVEQTERLAAVGKPARHVPAVMPVGAVMAVRRAAWEQFGPFDESIGTMGGIYGEENDFWAKATHAGFLAATATDAWAYHESHATMGAGAGAMENAGYTDFRRRRLGATTNGDWYDARRAESKAADPRARIMRRVRSARVESQRPRVAFYHPGAHLCGGNLATINIANRLIERGIDAVVAFSRDRYGEWRTMTPHFGPVVADTPADWVRAGGFERGLLFATDWRTGQFVRDVANRHRDIVPLAFVQDREDWFRDGKGKLAFDAPSEYAPYLEVARGGCVVNATWVADSLARDHGLAADRMHWIGIGTDPDLFYDRGLRSADGPVKLLAFSRPFTPRRGNQLLALMWMRLAEKYGSRVELYTYGDVPTHMLPAKHLGKMPQTKLAVEMARMHGLLEPSLSQAWGMAAHEMMATGGAVVSHANGGISHYATDGEDALIVQGNPDGSQDHDGIFAALCRIVEDAPLRARLGAKARESAKRFSWDAVADEWEIRVRAWWKAHYGDA